MSNLAGSGAGRRHPARESGPGSDLHQESRSGRCSEGSRAAEEPTWLSPHPGGCLQRSRGWLPSPITGRVSEEEVVLEEAAWWLDGHLSSSPTNKRSVHGVVAIVLGSMSMGRREGRFSHRRPPTHHPRPLLLRQGEDRKSKKALRREGSSMQRQVKHIGLDGKRQYHQAGIKHP